jgi:uncharacterized protein YciI
VFLVRGVDGERFEYGANELHAAHQAYMDRWADRLVARGPTLSDDGEHHTGSIHVLGVDDRSTAERFAFAEPYAHAGWYASVSVLSMVPLVGGTMWDRPRPDPEPPAAFVSVTWSPRPVEQQWVTRAREGFVRFDDPPWLFGGLLTADDGHGSVGLVCAADLTPTDAARRVDTVLAHVEVAAAHVEVRRWSRGGRQAGTI